MNAPPMSGFPTGVAGSLSSIAIPNTSKDMHAMITTGIGQVLHVQEVQKFSIFSLSITEVQY